jgi:hypothetical protein
MHERYTMRGDVRLIEGTATYGNFRQLQGQAGEKGGPAR